MPIHVILGKPGSGKSYRATMLLVKELTTTRRRIITNLPINVGELNAYVQEKYPAENYETVSRVRLLQDEEIRYFWRFRKVDDVAPPQLFELARTTDKHERAALEAFIKEWSEKPILPERDDPGCAYFLDEAQIAFNARDWGTLGKACLFYLSQHRKLGDVVYPITQACSNLDKQFRSVAEDFTVCKNGYTMTYGVFKAQGRFRWTSYATEPTKGTESFGTGVYHLEPKGIGRCYDTARGIGVQGNKADIGRRAKGIPLWMAIPGFIALTSLLIIVPTIMSKFFVKVQESKLPAVHKQKDEPAVEKPDVVKPQPVAAVSEISRLTAPAELWCVALIVHRGRWTAWLSNGAKITDQDGLVARLSARHLEMTDGTLIEIRKGVRPEGEEVVTR